MDAPDPRGANAEQAGFAERIRMLSFTKCLIMVTIYHNPRCSKSREALALVEQFAARQGVPLEVVEYLQTPPTVPQLLTLHALLGGDIRDMVRSNEDEYAALGLANADDSALLEAIAAHPKLLQRPIVVHAGRALIGRPPERLNEILAGD